MKTYPSLHITGSMSWDTIMDFPKAFVDYLQPEKLHQINVSFVIDNLEKQMGGTATNIAYGAAETRRLLKSKKGPRVSVLGGLGKDGKEHVAFFKKNNIDTKGIHFDLDKYSANGSVITDIKDNQIWGFYYGACEAGKDSDFGSIVEKNSLMIVAANHPRAFMVAQKFASDNKIDYLYDPGMSLTWITDRDLKQGVKNARFLVGNDYEIAMITKRIKTSVKDLLKKGISVITTLGEKGVQMEFPDKQLKYIPAVKIRFVKDPTGAGDAWRGGFLMATALGYDMIDCLKIGNVVASFAIEHYGTVNYRISKKEFKKRMLSIQL